VTPLDLLFLASALFVAVTLVLIVYRLVRGHRDSAARTMGILIAYVAIYLAILISVSLVTPQKVLAIGEERCFDEWCITVTGVSRESRIGDATAQGVFEIVNAKVSSHSHGRRQREVGVRTYLLDALGHRFDIAAAGQRELERAGQAGQPIETFVDPGGSFETRLVYDVPAGTSELGFVKTGAGPGSLIIGDSDSFFHQPTIVRLDAPVAPVR
jgi:hypothetical protein